MPACTATLLSVTLACANGSLIRESVEYYPVRGKTATELTASMASNGPRHPRGRNAWGLTEWEMRLHYELEQANGQCQLRNPQIELTLRIVLPQWRTTAGAAPGLRQQWQQAQRQIIAHELEHRRHAHLATADAQRQLLQLPPAPSCALADRQAQVVLRTASQQARRASLQFDLDSDYGARSGIGLQP